MLRYPHDRPAILAALIVCCLIVVGVMWCCEPGVRTNIDCFLLWLKTSIHMGLIR